MPKFETSRITINERLFSSHSIPHFLSNQAKIDTLSLSSLESKCNFLQSENKQLNCLKALKLLSLSLFLCVYVCLCEISSFFFFLPLSISISSSASIATNLPHHPCAQLTALSPLHDCAARRSFSQDFRLRMDVGGVL